MSFRKAIRISGYDYAQPGAYFVTICSFDRKLLFGEIKNEQMRMNSLGKLIQFSWQDIPNHFENVSMDQFVVMPNHIHGILFLSECRGTACRAPTSEQFGKPIKNSLSTIVRSFKASVTKRFHETSQGPVWQRGYFEHVVRNEESLLRIQEYIISNPMRWHLDKNNTDSIDTDVFDQWVESFKNKPQTLTP